MNEILRSTDDEVLRGTAVGIAAACIAPLDVDIQSHIDSYRWINACNETTILCTDTAVATLRSTHEARKRLAVGCPSAIPYLQTVDPEAVNMAYRLVASTKS